MPVIPWRQRSRSSARSASTWRVLLLLATLALLLSLPTTAQAAAPYCRATENVRLDFGTVTSTSQRDATTSLVIECVGSTDNLILPVYFQACVFVGEGTPTGMAPRRMINGNGDHMKYDLYTNSSYNQLIGPSNSNYPLYSFSFNLPPREVRRFSIFFHGRVHAGQNLPATSVFSGKPQGSVVRYSYGFVHVPTESDCRDGRAGHLGGAGSAPFDWSSVDARMANTCHITTATDLDFGTVGRLTEALDQTSVIKLKCAASTNWQVTLNNGANALAGARYMTSGSTRIGYELYRDAGRLQRWGSTTATRVSGTSAEQSLTVYGRIPAVADTVTGSYRDVITVTLTY